MADEHDWLAERFEEQRPHLRAVAIRMLGSATDDGEYGQWVKPPASRDAATTLGVYVVVDDCDAHCARARAAGALIVREPKDEDYGGRGYPCRDLEGHVWSFGTYDPWAAHGR